MAYEIRIRGHKEPVVVENNSERLMRDWKNYQLTGKDFVVEVNSWVGKISSILDFQKVKVSEASKESSRSHEEYIEDRKKILDMPVEERAKNMGWFRLVYWTFTGKNSEDILIKDIPLENLIEEEQLRFFSKNPKAIHCDVDIFKKYIKSNQANKFSIGVIESVIRQENFARSNL